MRDGAIIGVIGCGSMGSALIRGVVGAGVVPAASVIVADPRADAVAALVSELGVTAAAGNAAAAERAHVLVLAVKPHHLRAVVEEVAPSLPDGALAMSIAAGVSIATIERAMSDRTVAVIRAMPNTPCLVGAGASAYALGPHATDAHGSAAAEILGAVGLAIEVAERHMDAVTAVSGSGPAYVFRLLEALAEAARSVGLPNEVGARLATQTLLGAATLAAASPDSAATLRRRVTSPGGTTAAALAVLEGRGFGAALVDAVVAARDRGAELGRDA